MPELSGDPPGRDPPGYHLEQPGHFLVELTGKGTRCSLNGVWRSDEVVVIETGTTSTTYLGCCLAERQELHRRTAQALSTRQLSELTEFPGSFHVLINSPETFTAYGDVAGLKRLFYAELQGSWLVSDRADVLARRIGASLSDEWLALWLMWPPPWLPRFESPWIGVSSVPPSGCLRWRRGESRPEIVSYWTAPAARVPLCVGAGWLHEALAAAVSDRVQRAMAPSCDLSGGKDTTALTFLAGNVARGQVANGERLLAITLPSISPDNDDATWARAIAGTLDLVDHLVVPAETCPLPYDDLDEMVKGPDHPSMAIMHSARHRHLATCIRQAGRGDDHISGHGGDEVLEASPAYVRSLLLRHPLQAIRRLRQHCALAGTPVPSATRTVLGPGRYGRWLRHTAAHVVARRPDQRTGDEFGWHRMPVAPPWLTDHAIGLAATALERAAQTLTPYSSDITQHATLAGVYAGTETARLHQQFMAGLGVRLHCPYFDRTVVESAMAVQAHERTDPTAFKPLLDAAMASTVPERFRTRATKGHYTDDSAWGLYRNRRRIAGLLANSRLVERGLVDARIANQALESLRIGDGSLALTDTLNCERWLRSIEEAT